MPENASSVVFWFVNKLPPWQFVIDENADLKLFYLALIPVAPLNFM